MKRPTLPRQDAAIVGLCILVMSGLSWADDPPVIIEQRLSQSAMLAVACFSCHGTDGRQDAKGVPAIAGVDKEVLVTQMMAFRQGNRPDATVMDRIARGFSEQEIHLLADYFSRLPKQKTAAGEKTP